MLFQFANSHWILFSHSGYKLLYGPEQSKGDADGVWANVDLVGLAEELAEPAAEMLGVADADRLGVVDGALVGEKLGERAGELLGEGVAVIPQTMLIPAVETPGQSPTFVGPSHLFKYACIEHRVPSTPLEV